MNPKSKIIIDFADIFVVSSSFADEVLVMLFHELGAINFMSRIEFVNVDKTVRGLIDRVIMQRMVLPKPESENEK